VLVEEGELRGERPYPLPPLTTPTITFATPAPHIGLILPTSLCAGPIAQMAAQRLNQTELPQALGISRFATVVHTEGCGVSRGSLSLYTQTLLGHLTHPLVKHALLLEHGCEKTHNDYFRQAMLTNGRSPDEFGWASIQLDGGIQAVLAKMAGWFSERRGAEAQRGWGDKEQGRISASSFDKLRTGSAQSLTIGLLATGSLSEQAAAGMMNLAQAVVANGGSVLVPEHFGLAMDQVFGAGMEEQRPSLSYGRMPETPGLHIMATPNCNWSEVISGLGAAGANIIVAAIGDHPRQGHPFIPVLQVSDAPQVIEMYADDLDGDTAVFAQPENLTHLVQTTLAGEVTPKCNQSQNVYFQISRGLLGIST
jgi:altronate dehydratase